MDATGIGDIGLHITSGHKLKLSNVLYVPESCFRLVSILAPNKSSDYTTHIDLDEGIQRSSWRRTMDTNATRTTVSKNSKMKETPLTAPSLVRSQLQQALRSDGYDVTRHEGIVSAHRTCKRLPSPEHRLFGEDKIQLKQRIFACRRNSLLAVTRHNMSD